MLPVATDSGADGADEMPAVAEQLAGVEETVLLYGPAMSGKRGLGLDLLAGTVAGSGGRPFYVTTVGTAAEARDRLDARTGVDHPRAGVVTCEGPAAAPEAEDPFTRGVATPADVAGIAVALSGMYEDSRRSRRVGSCVLVDNVSDLLVAADLEPVYRFLHALLARVDRAGGTAVATLDTDGLAGAERLALTGLFDTVVRVRHRNGRPEYRLHTDDDWHGHAGDS